MSLFSKRGLLVGVATFIISVAAVFAIWGLPNILARSVTVKGQVTSYLLDDRGAVTGLLLASGDQLRFNPQTGEAVAAQIKVGDEVTAIGHAGTRSGYGREVRIQQITANGHTILEARPDPARPPRGPHEKGDKHSPHHEPPIPPPGTAAVPPSAPAAGEREAQPTNNAPKADAGAANTQAGDGNAALTDSLSATGTIRTHLVNGHGDVDGIILSGGEQLRFPPHVGQLVIAAEQNTTQAQVSVSGAGKRNERGTVIHPAQLTIGNQTISLGR